MAIATSHLARRYLDRECHEASFVPSQCHDSVTLCVDVVVVKYQRLGETAVDTARRRKLFVHPKRVALSARRQLLRAPVFGIGEPQPTAPLGGAAAVAIRAHDLAARDLGPQIFNRGAACEQLGDVLPPGLDVVEVEDANVRLSTIHTRVAA